MSSSYYSTRALQESGKNQGPIQTTVNVILIDVWVDDLLSGTGTLEEICVPQDDLIQTLTKVSPTTQVEEQRAPTGHSSPQRPSRSWQGFRN